MKYNLEKNTNNSKKIIIGVSILFCTVILVIGGTIAFFTQSQSESTGNIVSSNDNDAYINYVEEKSMMFDNLIPMKSEDIEKALFRENTCVDDNGYNVCSAYMFSLENTYGEVQKINISMIPTANSFTNLKYMVVKIGADGMPTFITEEPLPIEKNNLNPITLIENEILYSGQENISTYAIIFYIESMDYDQTEEDAGKQFGASIRIDSITTGKYIIKSFGDSCWDLEFIHGTIGEYKLTKFYGINDDGSVREECSGFVGQDEKGYYSINVPSLVGGYKITTIGNELFNSISYTSNGNGITEVVNNYSKIKSIKIEEGITTIEDGKNNGNISEIRGSFLGTGFKLEDGVFLNVELPHTLSYIGSYAFNTANIVDIELPSNLQIIGDYAFFNNNITTLTIPNSVTTIGKNTFYLNSNLTTLTFEEGSKLTTIGDDAFSSNSITSLTIPNSVQTIGDYAFELNSITSLTIPNSVQTIGERAFSSNSITSLTIPNSVQTIGERAFSSNENLTTLIFEEGSKLTTIGDYAFHQCALDYQNEDSPLYLPNNEFKTIGASVFGSNSNLRYIYYEGDTTGFGQYWHGGATLLPRRN